MLFGEKRPPLDRSSASGAWFVRSIATYEAGAALFAAHERRNSGLVDDLERVSIVHRGQQYARIEYERQQDDAYLLVTKDQAYVQLELLLAGHAAEEVVGLESTTYAVMDMKRATVRC